MLNFKGGPKEIGKQMSRYYLDNKPADNADVMDGLLLSKQIEIYEKYFPQVLEEYREIERSASLKQDQFVYYALLGEKIMIDKNLEKGCMVLAKRLDDGLVVKRNYDWIHEAKETSGIYTTYPTYGYKYLSFTDMNIRFPSDISDNYLLFNNCDCVNEHGLYIAMTYAKSQTMEFGLTSNDFIRLLATHCKTCEEVENFIQGIPLIVPKNFVVTDKQENLIIVEHKGNRYKIVRMQSDYIVKTNFYLDKELAADDLFHWKTPFDYAVSVLEGSNLDDDGLCKLTKELKGPDYTLPFETIWTTTYKPREQIVSYESAKETHCFKLNELFKN